MLRFRVLGFKGFEGLGFKGWGKAKGKVLHSFLFGFFLSLEDFFFAFLRLGFDVLKAED